jgi:hypothetical protein
MTTAQLVESGLVSFDKVKELIGYMVEDGVIQAYPMESQGKYHNEAIEEIIIDEEGSVFILLSEEVEPVMLPHIVEAVGY